MHPFCIVAGLMLLAIQALASTSKPSPSEDDREILWSLNAGRSALAAGLPSVAEAIFEKAASLEAASPELRTECLKQWAYALICQKKISQATETLSSCIAPFSDDYFLLQGVLHYNRSDLVGLEQSLTQIDPQKLTSTLQPWYYLLMGFSKKHQQDESGATANYQRALELSADPAQKARFEAYRLSGEIITGQVNRQTIEAIRQRFVENEGTRLGTGFAKQYAVALYQSKRPGEAIEILRKQLAYLAPSEVEEETHIQFLIGLISGPQSPLGRVAFLDVLRKSKDRSQIQTALYLLSQASTLEKPDEWNAFIESLNEAIGSSTHPIRDECLIMRAWMNYQAGRAVLSAQDAETLLAQYPSAASRNDALILLAYLSWKASPPRYRRAAELLGRIEFQNAHTSEKARIGRIIGDCYFKNQDFMAAASAYEATLAAVQSNPGSVPKDTVYALRYQQILSFISAKQFENAQNLLDGWMVQNENELGLRSQLESSLIQELRLSGQIEKALERALRRLQTPLDRDSGDKDRIRLIASRLAFQMGDFKQAKSLSTETLEKQRTRNLSSELLPQALLISAQSDLRLGKPDDALSLFRQIRLSYPDTEEAFQSCLEEARYHSSVFRLSDAQSLMRKAADDFPSHPLAPSVLLEAALIAQQQGEGRNLEEAIEIVKTLLERYPNDSRGYDAMLLQGHLARKLNRFAVAQKIYAEAYNRYKGTTLPLYLAKLYEGNCFRALSHRDPTQSDYAAAHFASLAADESIPDDVRLEAAYNLGSLYAGLGQIRRASDSFWSLSATYLGYTAKDSPDRLSPQSRYWLSRCLLDLAQLLAESQPQESARACQMLIDANLPGAHLAKARLKKIQAPGAP